MKVGLGSGTEVEVVVRNLDDLDKAEKCDIYGDPMIVLSSEDLDSLLRDPICLRGLFPRQASGPLG